MTDPSRDADIADFLTRAGWGDAERAPLAGDASNRRYDRLRDARGARAVLMDAPPAKGEDVRPFAAVTGALRERGFSAPSILAIDVARGFLLLEDLGDALFARVAAAQPDDAEALYAAAIDFLAVLHRAPTPARAEWAGDGARCVRALNPYDWTELRREAALAEEWWAPGADGEPAPADASQSALLDALESACADVAADRGALVLRDFHAENLIWLDDRRGVARVGLLDYQDAMIGAPAYDLVSLLEDARRDVDPALAERMIARYLAAADVADAQTFRRAYAVLGAQRNLKIIGIFARLWLRDGKDRYLMHIPRVWRYLRRDLDHPALVEVRAAVDRRLPEPTLERLTRLRETAPHGTEGAA